MKTDSSVDASHPLSPPFASGWVVYILECADTTFYTGITNNLERRLHQHNNTSGGARYTKCRRPVKLVYFEAATSKGEALKREYLVRNLPRSKKQELAQGFALSSS